MLRIFRLRDVVLERHPPVLVIEAQSELNRPGLDLLPEQAFRKAVTSHVQLAAHFLDNQSGKLSDLFRGGTADGKDTDYGIGWTVDRDAKGRLRVRHSGGAMGGTANLVIYPDLRLAVALLVNSDESFTGRAPAIAEAFANEGATLALHAGQRLSELEERVAAMPWARRAACMSADTSPPRGGAPLPTRFTFAP